MQVKIKHRYILAFVASASVGIAVGGMQAQGGAEMPEGSGTEGSGLAVRVHGYGGVVEPETALAIGRSFGDPVRVVRGTIVSVGGDRWSTSDGSGPRGLGAGGVGAGGAFIYRTAYLEVSEVVVGEPVTSKLLPVTVLGGKVGETEMFAAEVGPQLEAGETVLLFMSPGRLTQEVAPGNWIALLKYKTVAGKAYSESGEMFDEESLLVRIRGAADQLD